MNFKRGGALRSESPTPNAERKIRRLTAEETIPSTITGVASETTVPDRIPL
jgi:hypothetical protein